MRASLRPHHLKRGLLPSTTQHRLHLSGVACIAVVFFLAAAKGIGSLQELNPRLIREQDFRNRRRPRYRGRPSEPASSQPVEMIDVAAVLYCAGFARVFFTFPDSSSGLASEGLSSATT